MTSPSDQAITDYYDQARVVGYREGRAAALDAAHGALDDVAEKFGVKADAGIMHEFHAAIEALSGDAK